MWPDTKCEHEFWTCEQFQLYIIRHKPEVWFEVIERQDHAWSSGFTQGEMLTRATQVLEGKACHVQKARWIVLVASVVHPDTQAWLQNARTTQEEPLLALIEHASAVASQRWLLASTFLLDAVLSVPLGE